MMTWLSSSDSVIITRVTSDAGSYGRWARWADDVASRARGGRGEKAGHCWRRARDTAANTRESPRRRSPGTKG